MAVIITDSTCDLTLNELNALNIEMISLKVNFGTSEYSDKTDITNEEFYEKLAQSSELPTTTLISIGEFMEQFERFEKDDIVVITISSKLSGTYQSAIAAKEMSHRDNIYVVDSTTVTGGMGLLVKQAAALRASGKNAQEIAETIEEMKSRVTILAIIDTLKYLVKGGRLSGVSGAVGSVLGIKPILTVENGVVNNVGKARGISAAITEAIKISNDNKPIDSSMPYAFVHSNNEPLTAQFASELKLSIDSSNTYMIGSVIGTHAGPGAVGICYFEKK